ncbi:MAG TPA: magnesium-translocating P-type ATPase [Dongiaceae bacterium]|nr:magnesium-translocating P-type ATPase [Dongiaceae bacterium]
MSEGNSSNLFWRWSMDEAPRHLELAGDGLSGLTSAEAAARQRLHGLNRLQAKPHFSLARKFIGRFRNPLVLILLAAAAISAMTGDVSSCIIISAIVGISVLLDSLQEFRAEQAAEKLRVSVSLKEQVLRDGKPVTLPATEIVPGDVVLLAAGDMVPADGRIVEARDFFVNEALLTGESYPAEKQPVPAGIATDAIAEATNAAFMGTSVVSGSAHLLVCATGKSTQLGEISSALRHTPPAAALEQGTYDFGLLIVRITGLLVLFVLLINLAFHRPLLESFLFALALAVGLTPELLPMVVSVTLAQGAMRMAKEKVIVKRLAAIHDLGSMDVFCTDKTGTLTEAKIRLVKELTLSGAESERVVDLAWLNSHFESGLRSPLDDAILDHAPATSSPVAREGWNKLDEVPFGFERRRVSVLVERAGRRLLIVKGAPEDVLKHSNRYEENGEGDLHPLDDAAHAKAQAVFDALGRDGFRVLGVAWREVAADRDHADVSDESELVFAGFAAFLDPPKESAGRTIIALGKAGIAVKILTGDNELVTQHVCADLGIPVAGLLTGADLAVMSDEALSARVEDTDLFCRVTPVQKNRILLALKRRGHVVGYMGDGINDAPSLHSADVGISVDSAVDVAKDAADIILLDRDLGVLARGVREGRRTFGNIMKYVMMGTSSNFGNMFSMAGAVVMLPFLPMLPIQVLLNNLLYDLSEVPIPLDEVDEEMMATPHHWDIGFIRRFMLLLGPVSSLFDFLTFGLLLFVFHANEKMFQTGWFIESLATQVFVIFVIRTRRNPFRSRPSRLLTVCSLSVVAIAIALPYSPLGPWLGFVPLPLDFLAALAVMVVVYLCLAEIAKNWFYRHLPPAAQARAAVLRPNLPMMLR